MLCGAADPVGRWACHGLRRRGLEPVDLVDVELLTRAVRWDHRVGADGASVEVVLADGRTLSSERTRGVLNRILHVPPAATAAAAAHDRDYALQELTAFFLSWLHALPGPVLGRPTPQGLSGAWRHVSEWVWLAAAAGLPAAPYRQGSSWTDGTATEPALVPPGTPVRTEVVIGGEPVTGWATGELREGCERLARLAEADVLGVDFAVGPYGIGFAGASPLPDLRLAGEPALDRIAALLRDESP